MEKRCHPAHRNLQPRGDLQSRKKPQVDFPC